MPNVKHDNKAPTHKKEEQVSKKSWTRRIPYVFLCTQNPVEKLIYS